MLTLTFVRPVDLVAPLNINDSFSNTAIIKQNNKTYKHKVIFSIRDRFAYGFGVGTYIPVTHPIPVFLKSGKTRTHNHTQSKWGKSIKMDLVRAGNHGYGLCYHA